MISGLLTNLALLRRIAVALGLIGVVWGAAVTLVAMEVVGADSPLSPVDGRSGFGIGLGTLAAWLACAAGTAMIPRLPSVASALLFLGACAGFFLVGAPWIGPGTVLASASWLALLGIPNPFQAEMDREAAARATAAGSTAPQE